MDKKTVLMVYTILLPLFLYSQEKWSLEKCIKYAHENNLEIKIKEYDAFNDRNFYNKSKINYIPKVSMNTNYEFQQNRMLDQNNYAYNKIQYNNSFNSGLYLETTVFDGFNSYYNLKKHYFDLRTTMAEIESLMNDISISVTLSYMNILLKKEIIISLEKQIEISENNLQRVIQLSQEGMITEEDFHNINIQLANEKYSLAEAQSGLNEEILALCSLLNIRDYEIFDTDDSIAYEFSPMIDLASVISSAMSLPRIQAEKFKLLSARYNKKSAASEIYPIITVSAGFQSSFSDQRKKVYLDVYKNEKYVENYSFASQLKDYQNSFISLSLKIPLTNILYVKKNITIANNIIKQRLINKELIEKELVESIYKIYNEVQTAESKYKFSLSSIEHSTKLLEFTNSKLLNGISTANEYVMAKNNLLIAHAQSSSVKYEYFFKLKLLLFYLNHEIKSK